MSIPDRSQAASLYLSLDPPPWHLRHSRAVAEIAAWLALRAQQAGRSLDRHLVESAALLHDVDKLPAVKPEVAGLRHADGSAEWLTRHGLAELAPVVASHPVTRLADGDWFEAWFPTATTEALLVSYADKRAGQNLEPMAGRFASWKRRYPPEERKLKSGDSWSAATVEAVWRRSLAIEARVCELAGGAPPDVLRLRWTDLALRRARGA